MHNIIVNEDESLVKTSETSSKSLYKIALKTESKLYF